MVNVVNSSGVMNNPAPYSEQPFIFANTLGTDFQLGEYTKLYDAKSQQTPYQPFRAINCTVDTTMPVADGDVVILAENGQTFTYTVMNSGVHVILGYQIISIGSAIDSTRFQVLF